MITAEMIRQYFYCPRKIYWRIVLPERPRTPQIKRGLRIHKKAWQGRRIIKKQGEIIEELIRKYPLSSEKLGISGIVDAIIIRKIGNEIINIVPIEIKTGSKYTKRPEKQHIMQLVTYILLAQEEWGTEKVTHGYIIYKDTKEKYRIEPTEDLIQELNNAIRDLREILEKEKIPPPTKNKKKCHACEYRKICRGI